MNLSDVVGSVIDGKYHVERMLGRGGMGAVFFATHLGTERPVALKIIVPQYAADASFLERFRREARAAGRFRHPNIVDVTDFGFSEIGDQRVAYLVMEYLDGCSLEDVLIEQPVVPVDWTVEVFDQLSLGIGELHRKGIIHRDLKPGNIWLEPNLRGGFTVKLLDFGLAKLNEAEPADDVVVPPVVKVVSSTDTTMVGGAGTAGRAIDQPPPVMPASEAPTMLSAPKVVPSPPVMPASEAPTLVSAQNLPASPVTVPASEAATMLSGALDATRVDGVASPTAEPVGSAATEPSRDLTVAGSVVGTPAYMSPEQCRGEVATAASDVYSLGVIAYQMLAGAPPFEGGMGQLMAQHTHSTPKDLCARNPDVPNAVSAVVMSAIAKDANDRPMTVELFAASLKAKAESPWDLVSRGIVMLIENLPVFLRTTAMLLLPYFVLVAVEALLFIAFVDSGGYERAARSALGALAPVNWLVILLGTIFARGVTTLLIGQILLVPLKKLRVELVFSLLRRKLLAATQAAAVVGLVAILPATIGFGLLKAVVVSTLVPATSSMGAAAAMIGPTASIVIGAVLLLFAFLVSCELTQLANVILVENFPIGPAIRRSRELRRRATADTVVVAAFIMIPILIPTVVELMQAHYVEGPVAGAFAALAVCLSRLALVTFIAVLVATLYFKQRLTAGESIEAVLACQYVSEPPPKTMWQQRLSVSLDTLRSGERNSLASGYRSGARSGAGSGARSGARSDTKPSKGNG